MSWLRRDPDLEVLAEERRLVARMLAGDEWAFESFASSYVPALYRFAGRALGEREATRDVAQATVCKAIAQLSTFRGEAGLATWLCAICRNEIAAHFRRRLRAAREVPLPLDGEGAERAVELTAPAAASGAEQALLQRERADLVHQALDALPPHYGQVLEWKYLDQLPVEEVARRLELRPKAAESVLTRARRAFRQVFADLVAGEVRGGRVRRGERRTWAQSHRPEEEVAHDV